MIAVKVINCYDCPFWNDGASGEYGETCQAPNGSDLPLAFIWDEKKDDKRLKRSAPKDCPLRNFSVNIIAVYGGKK